MRDREVLERIIENHMNLYRNHPDVALNEKWLVNYINELNERRPKAAFEYWNEYVELKDRYFWEKTLTDDYKKQQK